MSNVDVLNEAIATALGQGRSSCLLDLSGVTFIDSTVLRLLIKWAQDAQLSELEALAIVVPDENTTVQRIFHLSGVTSTLLPLFGSVAAGRAALREGQRTREQRRLHWLTDAQLAAEHGEATAA